MALTWRPEARSARIAGGALVRLGWRESWALGRHAGPLLDRLIPHLDGTATREEILRELRPDVARQVDRLITHLVDFGAVVDAEPVPAAPLPGGLDTWLAAADASPARAVTRLSRSRILVVGEVPAAAALAEHLAELGIGHVQHWHDGEGSDVSGATAVVHLAERYGDVMALRLDRLCREAGRPFLHGGRLGATLALGPAGSPCLECVVARLGRDRRDETAPSSAAVAILAARAVLRTIGASGAGDAGGLEIIGSSPPSVARRRVASRPGCPHCGPPAREGDAPSPEEEVARRAAPLVDGEGGVLTSLTCDGLPQLPFPQWAVAARGWARPETAIGWTLSGARSEAILSALARVEPDGRTVVSCGLTSAHAAARCLLDAGRLGWLPRGHPLPEADATVLAERLSPPVVACALRALARHLRLIVTARRWPLLGGQAIRCELAAGESPASCEVGIDEASAVTRAALRLLHAHRHVFHRRHEGLELLGTQLTPPARLAWDDWLRDADRHRAGVRIQPVPGADRAVPGFDLVRACR